MWIPNWLAVFQALSFRSRSVSSRRRRQLRSWASAEVLECRLCLSAASAPTVSLENDTGTAGDNITTDPTLTGAIPADAGLEPVYVVFDFNGDGIGDDYTYTNPDGSYVYDPTNFITYGQVTIKVQSAEIDPNTGNYSFSDWTTFTFSYVAPPNDPPAISSVSLLNDTGTAGDNVTTDPTLTGMVTNDGSMDSVQVEFDFDGDGIPDDYTYPNADGSFRYDPSSNIAYGQVTINVRASEIDPNTGETLYSGWTAITFTYQAPNPPVIASLSLQNDTGTAGDNITSDPTLAGMVTTDGSMDNVSVEFDFDGDGIPDDYTYPNADGSFQYDPSANLQYGQVTIYVRAVEFDPNTGQSVDSGWTAITFDYVRPN